MSFSNEYKAGFKGDSHGVDTFSYSYQMGAMDRDRQIREGTSSSGGDGSAAGMAAGGGGIVMVAMLVIIAFCAFVIALCSYPIAGFATLVTFLIGSAMAGAGINFVGMVFILMLPCYIIYYLLLPLEHKIGKWRPYRVFRHYWRIVVGTFAIHTLGTAFHRPDNALEGPPLSGYLIDAAMTFFGFFLLYLNSRRLDRKYELEPINTWWIDYLLHPIRDRMIPVISPDVRETGLLPAQTNGGENIQLAIAANGIATLGPNKVPVGRIREIEYEREHRAALLIGGVILFFATPIIVKAMFGEFNSFFAQVFAVAGWLVSGLMVILTYVQKTPPGKLAGPFRWLNIFYHDNQDNMQSLNVRFKRAIDERMFTQALSNHLRAMPRLESPSGAPAAAAVPVPAT